MSQMERDRAKHTLSTLDTLIQHLCGNDLEKRNNLISCHNDLQSCSNDLLTSGNDLVSCGNNIKC